MKLPNADRAWIPAEKLTDYLLSTAHPIGRAKAAFFRGHGFDEENRDQLAEGLLGIARSEEVRSSEASPYGMKYVVDGRLVTPAGAAVAIRSVWIVETGEEIPRFVTAFPA